MYSPFFSSFSWCSPLSHSLLHLFDSLQCGPKLKWLKCTLKLHPLLPSFTSLPAPSLLHVFDAFRHGPKLMRTCYTKWCILVFIHKYIQVCSLYLMCLWLDRCIDWVVEGLFREWGGAKVHTKIFLTCNVDCHNVLVIFCYQMGMDVLGGSSTWIDVVGKQEREDGGSSFFVRICLRIIWQGLHCLYVFVRQGNQTSDQSFVRRSVDMKC